MCERLCSATKDVTVRIAVMRMHTDINHMGPNYGDKHKPGQSRKRLKPSRRYQGSALYATKYQSSWKKELDFVSPSPSSKCHFRCKVCNKDVCVSHQGALDIQRQADGKLHKLQTAALRKPRLGFKPSSDPVLVLQLQKLETQF